MPAIPTPNLAAAIILILGSLGIAESPSAVSFAQQTRRAEELDTGVLEDGDPETCLSFVAGSAPPCQTDFTLTLAQNFSNNVTVAIIGDNIYCDQSQAAGKLFVVPLAANATGQPLGQTKTCTPFNLTLSDRQTGEEEYCTLLCEKDGDIGTIRIMHRPYHMPCDSWSLCEVMVPAAAGLPLVVADVRASNVQPPVLQHAAIFATDNNPDTFWYAGNYFEAWIQVDFQTAHKVRSLDVLLRCDLMFQTTSYRASFSDNSSQELSKPCPPDCPQPEGVDITRALYTLRVTPTQTTFLRLQALEKCGSVTSTLIHYLHEVVIWG